MNPVKIYKFHAALQYNMSYLDLVVIVVCLCLASKWLDIVRPIRSSFQMPDSLFSWQWISKCVWQQHICNLTICRHIKWNIGQIAAVNENESEMREGREREREERIHWQYSRWHIFDKTHKPCRCIWPTASILISGFKILILSRVTDSESHIFIHSRTIFYC